MNESQKLEDIQHIRQMMERSSRFLSLSGLSGILAGIYALIGTYFLHQASGLTLSGSYTGSNVPIDTDFTTYSIIVALSVLVISLITALIMSLRKAKKKGESVLGKPAMMLAYHLFIPLMAGGILCVVFYWRDYFELCIPITLMFYGMGLVNSSKYSLSELHILGLIELLLGIAAAFWLRQSLLFWGFGFGVMHIIYGTYMYFKYDR